MSSVWRAPSIPVVLWCPTHRVPWESIQNMASLHTLNLDHNLIDHIAEGVFGELYKLARLDMTSNRLRTLPPDPLFAR